MSVCVCVCGGGGLAVEAYALPLADQGGVRSHYLLKMCMADLGSMPLKMSSIR